MSMNQSQKSVDVAAPLADAPCGIQAPTQAARLWHELKTDPDMFDAVECGTKTFEIRFNDRDFKIGDGLLLRRTRYTGRTMSLGMPLEYTGEEARRLVTHVLCGPVYGLADGWVVLSLVPALDRAA